jgi:hypothetical protein
MFFQCPLLLYELSLLWFSLPFSKLSQNINSIVFVIQPTVTFYHSLAALIPHPSTSGGQNDNFRPLTPWGEGHGVQGQICAILRPQLAMNRFLPLWPHRFPHFGYINLGEGAWGGSDIRSMQVSMPTSARHYHFSAHCILSSSSSLINIYYSHRSLSSLSTQSNVFSVPLFNSLTCTQLSSMASGHSPLINTLVISCHSLVV